MDISQPAMNQLLKSVGFDVDKPADLHFTGKEGVVTNGNDPFAKRRLPVTKGRPDSTFIGHGMLGGYAEAKTSQGPQYERFSYKQFDDNKRHWWDKRKHLNIPYWIFIQYGKLLRHAKYPKMALFMPVPVLLLLEENSTMKSLPYAQAAEMTEYRLTWVPAQGFTFHDNHPFMIHYFGGPHGRNHSA